MKDLVALVADRDIEAAISKLLRRHQALSIAEISVDVLRHPQRDPGCHKVGSSFLASLRDQYRHALLVFDAAWEGATPATQQQTKVESDFARDGIEAWASVVVIDPELEAWVFSDSPHVDKCLGWSGRTLSARGWLERRGLAEPGRAKPADPKAAVEAVLREIRKPRSSAIYGELASRVSVDRCVDPAFQRLRSQLQVWFPAAGTNA